MENASKGLLIAAAVLIAILLVTISIKILSPATGVLEDSEQLGSAISSSSEGAVDKFQASVGGSKWTQNGTVVKKGSLTLEVGDYINYNSGVSDYTGTWRILGVENNKLLIISDKQVKQSVKLEGGNDYLNGITKLNNICSKYGNGKYAVGARCINLEDVNRVTKYNPATSGNYATGISAYGNSVTYYIKDGKLAYTTTNGMVGGNFPLSFEMPDGRVLGEDIEQITVTSNYYCYKPNSLNDNAYETLFGFKASYWLATQVINPSGSGATFGIYMISNGQVNGNIILHRTNNDYGGIDGTNWVRAVVYLKSDIQLQKNGYTWEII